MPDLERSISRFVRARRAERAAAEPVDGMTAPAFRALVAERLRILERDVAEVRARVNGVLFVVAGAVITQVVLRVVG